MMVQSNSESKSLVVDRETTCPKISSSWTTKRKRSPCNEYKTEDEKKIKTNDQVYEGIVKEINSFSKDKKEEQEFLEVADLVYFMRTVKTIPQEEITQIKREYFKAAEQVLENKVDNERGHKKKKKTRSKFSKRRKIVKEKVKRVISENLILEAEKREGNPPIEVLNKVESMNGSNLKFLMEKELLKTDMSWSHDRLSLPVIQVAREFLNEDEIEEFERGPIDVLVIEPCDLESSIKLRIWSSGSDVYALRAGWRDIALRKENGLKSGIKIDIWSFRKENNQLCFQILKANEARNDLQVS